MMEKASATMVGRLAYVLVSALALMTLFPEHPAVAASFDCAQARTQREMAICSSPDLSDEDTKIGQVYAADLAKVSPEAASIMRVGQRSWLTSLDAQCPPTAPDASDAAKYVRCLSSAYSDRNRQLAAAVFSMGPLNLFVVTRVLTASIDGNQLVSSVEYPQMDHPKSPVLEAWNRMIAFAPAARGYCDNGAGNLDVSVEVSFASDRLISTSATTSFYCPGTPHGLSNTVASTFLLDGQPHALMADELFKANSGWQDHMTAAVVSDVSAVAEKQTTNTSDLDLNAARKAALTPSRWMFTRDALVIRFDPYELGLGYTFEPDIHIALQSLAPYLQPGLGLPPS